MKSNFYVYGLYSPGRQKGELFYVGKGTGHRAWRHYTPSLLKSNTHKNNIIKKQRTYPMIRNGGLTEKFAHALEMRLIQVYKPQLTNKTDSGEGVSGYRHSQKVRAKISESRDRKPFLIKTEDGAVVLRAESTCCGVAQEFLSKSSGYISNLLNGNYLLFFKINGNIYYLEYENQTIEERAKLLGRSIVKDLAKVKAFKSEITVEKDGKYYYLKGYKSYSDAGKQLGLITHSELSEFWKLVMGKIRSVCGYKLVSDGHR